MPSYKAQNDENPIVFNEIKESRVNIASYQQIVTEVLKYLLYLHQDWNLTQRKNLHDDGHDRRSTQQKRINHCPDLGL